MVWKGENNYGGDNNLTRTRTRRVPRPPPPCWLTRRVPRPPSPHACGQTAEKGTVADCRTGLKTAAEDCYTSLGDVGTQPQDELWPKTLLGDVLEDLEDGEVNNFSTHGSVQYRWGVVCMGVCSTGGV